MKKRRVKALFLACAAMMSISLIGCGGTAQEDGTQTSKSSAQADSENTVKSEVHYAFSAQPPTLDLHTTSTTVAYTIGRGGIYETLVTLDEDYNYTCELAESVDISEDYKDYTFHLRKGVKFHNGKEMTADDVVASLNRWKSYYKNASAACGDADFVKVDTYTVSITLTESSMGFLEMMGGAQNASVIMPSEVIEAAGDGVVSEFIGTGPYKMDTWAQDQYIKVVKYEDYQPYGTEGESSGWGGYKDPQVETVYFEFVTDPATRVSGIQTGEYDFAMSLPSDNYEMLKANEDLTTMPVFNGGLSAIFDKSEGWTADPVFRKAVNVALNKEECAIASYGLVDFFRLDSSYMFKEQEKWYSTTGDESYQTYDQELAKSYLKECGYDGSEITIMVSSDYADFNNLGIAMEQELEEVGIQVNLLVVDWPTQQSYRTDPSKFDIFVTTFTPIAAPTDLLYLQSSWPGWSDDEMLSNYMSSIRTSVDADAAKEIWDECQAYLWDEYLPIVKICDKYTYDATSDKMAELRYFQTPIWWNAVVYE